MKKAQAGPVGVIILFLVFIMLYFIFGGAMVKEFGHQAVVIGQYTGLEAFLFENLNIFVFFIAVIGLVGYLTWASSG